MKKTAIALLLAGITASAGAQTMYDALNFSKSSYVGTARTVAMGNAFTALGGDLGAVAINPAGSAVARYSQIAITPGVNISVNSAMGTGIQSPVTGALEGFEKNLRTSMGRFAMPNFGFSINFDTHRISGLKNWTFGFSAEMTDCYLDDMMAKGTNSTTSFAGSLASFANGWFIDDLAAENAYDMVPVSDWKAVAGLQSGIIGLVPLFEGQPEEQGPTDQYIGVTEDAEEMSDLDGNRWWEIGLPSGGVLDQTFARRTTGSKYDYLINFGGNFSDKVFVGVNLGITSLNYSHQYYIRESAQDPSFFETGFNTLKYEYGYNATGIGVYGKFGLIVTPVSGLRLGAAFQTPTSMSITESWHLGAEQTSFSEDYRGGSSESPEGHYEYRLISPLRFNVGAAYTFGNIGLVSIDYEACNYRSMKFVEKSTNDNSAFDGVNTDIRSNMGMTHELRLGAEIKPLQSLAVRAGYNFSSSAIQEDIEYENQYIWEKYKGDTHSFSFGLGYSSKGSFYADAAVRMTKYGDTYIYPYDYWYFDGDQLLADTSVAVPEILSRRTLWNVLLTIGFRF